MKLRILGFLSCLLGLAALSFYSARVGAPAVDTVPEIKSRGDLPGGQEVALTSDVKIVEIGANDFTVEQGGARMDVRIPGELRANWEETKPTIKAGDYVSLRATYQSAGYLEAREYHVHKGRRLKIWVSLAALLVAALVIGKQAREGENA